MDMFLLLFICWVIFNQNFTLEIAIFGVVISGFVYLFACKFMGYSVRKDLFLAKKLPRILLYILVLFKEVIKANLVLIKIFFTGKKDREPVIVEFDSKLKNQVSRVFLANAITLTPGTITVSLKGNTFKVHCYDKSLAVGLNDTVFEKHLLKIEEGYEA